MALGQGKLTFDLERDVEGILPPKKPELRVHFFRKREVHQLVPLVYPIVRNSYGIHFIRLPLAEF